MSRLAIPARDDVPAASKPILDAVHKQLGVVPNMFRRAGPQQPLTGILAQAFAEPFFQSRPVGVGQIEEVIP